MSTQRPRVPKGTSRRLKAQPTTPVKPEDNRQAVTFYIDRDLSVELDKAYYLRKAERPSFTALSSAKPCCATRSRGRRADIRQVRLGTGIGTGQQLSH